jgi:hypothetical protein
VHNDYGKLADEGYSVFANLLNLLCFSKSKDEHANGSRGKKPSIVKINEPQIDVPWIDMLMLLHY